MSSSNPRPTTYGGVITPSAVMQLGRKSTIATVVTADDGRLQLALGDLSLFMTVESWRQLNATVERHLAEHVVPT